MLAGQTMTSSVRSGRISMLSGRSFINDKDWIMGKSIVAKLGWT